MQVACPTCRQKLAVKPESVGKSVRCTGCREMFTVPAAEAQMDLPDDERSR